MAMAVGNPIPCPVSSPRKNRLVSPTTAVVIAFPLLFALSLRLNYEAQLEFQGERNQFLRSKVEALRARTGHLAELKPLRWRILEVQAVWEELNRADRNVQFFFRNLEQLPEGISVRHASVSDEVIVLAEAAHPDLIPVAVEILSRSLAEVGVERYPRSTGEVNYSFEITGKLSSPPNEGDAG